MARTRYYAVSQGHAPAPGIFRSWSEVEPLIKGYPGNKHESFPTLEEAVRYLAERGVPEEQRVVVAPMDAMQDQGEDFSSPTA